jgi:hypothetical protein
MDTPQKHACETPETKGLLEQRFASFVGTAPEQCDPETRKWLFWLWTMFLDGD